MSRVIRLGIYMLLLLLSIQGSSQANPVMQLDGTDGGLVLNRLTNLQRNAIVNPISGLIIYNVDTGCLNYYSQSKWYATCGIEIETCTSNGDCPPGKICNNGVCVEDSSGRPCETEEQCPDGFACVDGFCVAL